MLLYMILWIAAGAIGHLVVGLYWGIKVGSIEDKYELDEHTGDYVVNVAMLATAFKVTPLARLALRLINDGPKGLWIVFGIINNAWNFIIWPVFLPLLWYNMAESVEELYRTIDYVNVKEGS